MMKRLLLLIAIIIAGAYPATSLGDAAATCDSCKANSAQMNRYLRSDGGVRAETILLEEEYCRDHGRPNETEACAEAFEKWWPRMGRAFFSKKGLEGEVCQAAGECPEGEKLVLGQRDDPMTCTECLSFVQKYGKAFFDNDLTSAMTTFLEGDGFCTAPDMPDDPSHECQKYVDMIMPEAAETLGGGIERAGRPLCEVVFAVCA